MPNSAISDSINTYHFEEVFASANISIIVTNSKGIITVINPFALKEFGYTANELIGKKIELLIPKRYHSIHSLHHNKYMKDPAAKIMGSEKELFAIKKDGTEFPIEVSLGKYNAKDQKYAIAFISDISTRNKRESEITGYNNQLEETIAQRTNELQKTLNKLKKTIKEQEHLLAYQRAIFNNAGAMIIATDKNGIIKLFNPEAASNIGYTSEEVTDKFTPLLFHLKNEIERKRALLLMEFGIEGLGDFEVLVEKSIRNIHEEEQYTYIRKNGSTFPVLLTISAIRDANNAVSGFMGIAIDNSARSRAEEDLKESLKKEKELNELKSRFVSMASHEFRTPLSTVLSSAYLIEKYIHTEEQPKREKHLQRITSSVTMLTDILNDFLSLGKIEEGKIQIRLTEFNIYELITLIIEEIKINLKNNQFIKYKHQGNPLVILDTSLLKHIIMNLVSNASKFSPETSKIEITTIHKNNTISLSVKDNGIGISKNDQQHLMERFFRGTNSDNIQGTGLGLHIISKYTELLNGTIKCISELEKGTEFVLVFNSKTTCNEKNIIN
jgi:PAS domain S-box-containing protein